MDTKVKLSEILDALDFQNDEITYYLDKATGKVHMLGPEESGAGEDDDPLESYPEWQREIVEIARRIAQGRDVGLIALPTKWDLDEYEIMREFCESLPEGMVQDAMCIAIRGQGAFRRFKDAIHTFDVAEDWYKYRAEQFKTIAINWCHDHDLEFIDEAKT